MMDVSRMLRRIFQKRMVGGELTLAQSRALVYIARNPGIRQVELAERLEVQPITLARLVDQLENCGLAERRPHPTDRRAYQLFQTDKAERYLEDMTEVLLRIGEDAFAGLNEDEMNALSTGLEKIHRNLSKQQGRHD
ncbi:MarR family transcriptional regulator [Proteobacteria bacterium 005FR1]|nr:MarR family transcriptional regulator [Proteobacteria bacterium 005FR1]